MYRRVSAANLSPATTMEAEENVYGVTGDEEDDFGDEEVQIGNRSTREGNYVSSKSHYYCRVAHDDEEDEYLM